MSSHDPYGSPQEDQRQPDYHQPTGQDGQPSSGPPQPGPGDSHQGEQGYPGYQQHGPPYPGYQQQGHPYGGYQQQGQPYGGYQQQGPPYPGYQQQGQPYGGYQGAPGYPGTQYPGPYGQPQQGYGYYNASVGTGHQPGVPVSFGAAIKRFYSKYAQFSGRASRSEYWWVALYLGIVYFVLSLLMTADTNAFGETGAFGSLMAVLLGIFALGHIVPSLAIGVRRLHDVDMSGWFMLLGLIPYLGALILLVFAVLPPKPEGARFDR